MKMSKSLMTAVLAVALLGCGKHKPTHIVILLDVSGSIDRQSLEQAIKAIESLAGDLQRGDSVTIIPILGDAHADASGRIIRFEVSKDRHAYDADLRGFQRMLSASLAELRANAITYPGLKTDIFGSVELAVQEFNVIGKKSVHLLLILGDFIQEDREFNFRKDDRVKNSVTAREFAMKLLKVHPVDLQGVNSYLGSLRSAEFGNMNRMRQNAIQEFWISYFKAAGAKVEFVTDGPGLFHKLRKLETLNDLAFRASR